MNPNSINAAAAQAFQGATLSGARDQSLVAADLETLDQELAGLQHVISTLLERLEPVMRPIPPVDSATKSAGNVPVPALSPLNERIRAQTARVQHMVTQLGNIGGALAI